MKLDHTKSNEMAEFSRQYIPAATINNWRYAVDPNPTYFTRGEGSHLFDVDGNEYIDYELSHGPAILGHSNEHMREALKRQIDRLYTPNISDQEAFAAQKISQHIQSAELVRFASAGTEANRGAIRVARAYTGRDKYLRFNGHYHGGLDHIMGGIIEDPERPIPVPGERENDRYSKYTNTLGRYSQALNECYMIEWNEIPILEAFFKSYGDEIAAVICEPVMVNNFGCLPEPGYLERLRQLCTEYGVVLIFDEVLTGFRIGLKGTQGYFGVIPDMTTLAKGLGAGVAVSATTGKREIMDVLTRADAVMGGTYSGNPLSMAGVIAAIEEYERDDGAVYKHIEKIGNLLREGLMQIAQEHDQPLLLQGFPGAWSITFNSKKDRIINHRDGCDGADFAKMGRFSALMHEFGVYFSKRLCTSAAHTEQDVQETLDRSNEVMKVLKEESVS